MHEAFETNNWYNDISTRDRSREGADEAMELSQGFKTPNYYIVGFHLAPGPPHWGPCARDAVSVLLPER